MGWPVDDERIIAAQQDGRSAALAGEPVSVCPHRLTGDETPSEAERVRFLQLMWARGYRHAKGQQEDARDGTTPRP